MAHSAFLCWMVLAFVGCSTTTKQLGSHGATLKVGKLYVLQRDAILLANRGSMDSIEHPKHNFQNYKPYDHYHPYYTKPIGVLPSGTVIEVKEIRFFQHGQFRVIGEIKTGEYVREKLNWWRAVKGVIIGPWPRTGKAIMNNLCGGKSFDAQELERNLIEQVE